VSFWDTLQKSVSNTWDHIQSDVAQPVAGSAVDAYKEMYWAATAVRAAVGIDSEAELQKARADVGMAAPTGSFTDRLTDGAALDSFTKNANAGTAAVGHALTMTENTPVVGPLTQGFEYGMNQALRGATTAAAVGTTWSGPFSSENWQRAWEATANDKPTDQHLTFGEAMTNTDSLDNVLDPAKLAKTREEIHSSWGNQALVEGMDLLGAVAFDPTRGVGRAMKAARVTNRIETSAQAEKVFEAAQKTDFGKADHARHVDQVMDFVTPNGMGPGPSAVGNLDALDRFIGFTEKSKVHKGSLPDKNEMAETFKRVARNGAGEGTSNILLHLFDHANQIEDVALRTQTKRNIMLAGAGSEGAKGALIAESPELARAMQRMTSAPEGMSVLDDLASAGMRPDVKLSDIAERIAESPHNAEELKGIAKRLDDFHARINELDARLYNTEGGGQFNEGVGLTAFDKFAAGLHTRVGYSHTYQDGVASRTMRVVGWATGKVAPGTINVADSFTGADQFTNTLKQSKAYTAAELQKMHSNFMTLGQNERNILVEKTMKDMAYRIAARHGMDKELADHVVGNVMAKVTDGRAFAARALVKQLTKEDKIAVERANIARKANQPGKVTLIEPGSNVGISVDHGLLEGHMAQSAVSLDPHLVERIVKYHAAEARDGIAGLKDRAAFKAQSTADFGVGLADLYTQIWKFGVLGRPGLGVRALLDTQLRSAVLIGGMHSLLNAAQGTGHAAARFNDRLAGKDHTFKVPPTTADLEQALYHDNIANRLEAQRASWGGRVDPHDAFFKDESAAYKDAAGKPMRSPKIDAIAERQQFKRDQLFERHQDLQSKLETLKGRNPKSPKQKASHDRMIANAQARIDKVALQLERVQDPTKLAKDARLGYLKGMAAHPRNMSRDDRMAATVAAHRATAESLREGTYEAHKFGLGVKAKKVNLPGGRTAESSAYWSAADEDSMALLLSHGGNAASAVMTANMKADIAKLRESNTSWSGSVKAEDPQWARQYVRATDALRNSPTAKRLMHAKTLLDDPREWHELYRTLRNDKNVKAEWAKMQAIHPDFEQWMQGVVRYVAHYVRDPLVNERLLRGARMTPKDVDALIPKGQRFGIHGPDIEYLQPPTAVEALQNARDKFFKAVLDKPDTYLVRHPTYVTLYNKNFKALAEKWVREQGDLTLAGKREIEARARHRSVQDIKRIMYDPSHLTNAHQTLRFIAPFIRPWEDAMRSWSRLIYDDAHTLGKMAVAWNAPNLAGLVVNENGDPVGPWGQNGGKEQYIVVNIPAKVATAGSWLTHGAIDAKDLTTFRLRKDSLNSIAQGDTPWLPGFGPMVQLPVQLMASKFFPEIYGHADNAVMRSLFLGGDIPKASFKELLKSQAPGYLKAVVDAFDDESGTYNRIYQTTINAKILEAQQKGLKPPSDIELDKMGTAAARSGGLIRAIASGLVGMSGMVTPEGNFYVEQYQTLRAAEPQLKAQGKTVDDVFAAYYPEAANLPWSISMNETGINATVQADNRARSLKSIIDKNPKFAWWVVGSDNVGGEFSRGVYNSQFANEFGPEGFGRRNRTKSETLDRSLAAAGWAKFEQVDAAVQFAMKQQGFRSLNQKGAADLADKKHALVERLKLDNPTWAADYEDRNGDKVQEFLRYAGTVMDDPKMKNRPDIQMLRQYLKYRDAGTRLAESQGFSLASIKKAAPIRARLSEIGNAFAQQDFGFGQTWQRVLAGEVEIR